MGHGGRVGERVVSETRAERHQMGGIAGSAGVGQSEPQTDFQVVDELEGTDMTSRQAAMAFIGVAICACVLPLTAGQAPAGQAPAGRGGAPPAGQQAQAPSRGGFGGAGPSR